MEKFNTLESGDVLIISCGKTKSYNCFVSCIKSMKRFKISHVGMLLKDPNILGFNEGLYVLDADMTAGHVRITKLEDFLKEYMHVQIFVKRLTIPKTKLFYDILHSNISRVYGKPYNLSYLKMAEAEFIPDNYLPPNKVENEKSFFCSQLVSFFLIKLGLLPDNIDIENITPHELAEDILLPFTKGTIVSQQLIFFK